jgi:hypothetical protein
MTKASSPADLQAAIARTEAAMRVHLRRTIPQAGIFSFGAVDIHPKHLAFWVKTATDAERDALLGDPGFRPAMRAILLDAGYPADAVPLVGFTAESQETVERDWGGNWWHRVK